jgi:regulator of replication initiation timing
MLQVILQYIDCLQDGKNVFRILSDFNITILKTNQKPDYKTQVVILVEDDNVLNLLISTLNRYCHYEVIIVERKEVQYTETKKAQGITSIPNNTIQIGIGLPKIKSHIKIGNLIFHNTHHFNWFHRMMWKLCFGFEIENLKEN